MPKRSWASQDFARLFADIQGMGANVRQLRDSPKAYSQGTRKTFVNETSTEWTGLGLGYSIRVFLRGCGSDLCLFCTAAAIKPHRL